jgi:hypothetical protein
MPITEQELQELDVLRSSIRDDIRLLHPDKMERFADLLVKSLHKKE